MNFEQVSNSGERILETDRSGLVREHKDRYRFAKRLILPSDTVLDCASGSGYGTKLLSPHSRKIIGIDASEVAVDFARHTYTDKRCEFRLGNAESLSIESGSIDVYCSFETIEHVKNSELLLKEAHRVLRPNGCLVVSTPNRVFSGIEKGEKPQNPFHLREWSLKEFDVELKEIFSNVQYFCQRVKSSNKFHPKYVESKFRRLSGLPDMNRISYSEPVLERLEFRASWFPMIYLAVCRK